MRAIRGIVGLTAVVAALAAGPARADVVADLSIAEMADLADLVVHGRVLSVEAGWDDERRRILTTVRLAALSYLGGRGPAEVLVRMVGGRVGETELRVAGQPELAPAEQVVLFLERTPELDLAGEPAYVLLCMAAGAFRVGHDRATGEVVLARDLAGVTRWRPAGAPARPASSARPLLLRDLAAEVRRVRGAEVGR